jgi:hypothetical protein
MTICGKTDKWKYGLTSLRLLLLYKTNMHTPNVHKNEVICLLPHVSAELRNLHAVYKPIFKIH